KNVGTAALVVSSINSDESAFTVSPTSFTLQPSDSQTVTVTFTPTQATGYSGSITIMHNASGSPSTVSVSGIGVTEALPIINVDPTSLSFGNVTVNTSSDKEFTITNDGTAELEVSSLNSDEGAFTVNPTSINVPVGESLNITVTFIPTEAREYNGTISITHNASGSPSTVSVSGIAFDYPNTISVNTSFTFGDITKTNSYRIIGIPGNNNLAISNYISGPSGKDGDWRAFWDSGSGNFTEYTTSGSSIFYFKPGRAFWVLSKEPISINLGNVPAVPLFAGNTYYSIPVHDEWNLISNPFEKNVSWDDVKAVNSPNLQPIHHYSSGYVSPKPTQLESYKGYYFFNDSGLTSLKIPYVIQGGGSLQKPQLNISQELEIVLAIKGERKSEITIGFYKGSKTGIDRLDIFSPPPTFCEISLASFNKNLETNYKYLEKDYREQVGKGVEFELKLKNATNKSLEFIFSGLEDFNEYGVYLLDKGLRKFYNIREQNIIEVNGAIRSRYYSLLIGTENYILEKTSNLLPTDYVLYQNFPNPFNPSTLIRFAVPSQSNVTITVYNMLGELVSKLIDNQLFQVGYYEVEFDGSNLASGVYIYKIQTGDPFTNSRNGFVDIKKMVLMK
ncbi:MAG: Ig-like domain-containing protein, partial [Candidatus Kariarchaeaceae archaeon]